MRNHHHYQIKLTTEEERKTVMTPGEFDHWLWKWNYSREFSKKIEAIVNLVHLNMNGRVRLILEKYGIKKLPDVEMGCDCLDIGNTIAAINVRTPALIINPFHLIHNLGQMTLEVIPHELAHLMEYYINDENLSDTNHHTSLWKDLFRQLNPHLPEYNQVIKAPERESIIRNLESGKMEISERDFIL